ncbi:MAG: hypothetical protein ACT4QC_19010 [Planctomycetaceae bacterium]
MTSILHNDPADCRSADESGAIFPLALTPFEQYMLADDRRDYPMTFFIELVLSGALDRKAFENSLAGALSRHPLLRAVAQRRATSWHWVAARQGPALVWSDGPPELPRLCDRRLDVRRAPGVRIWVGRTNDRSRVVFQFHHAATDGIGAVRFLGDLLALYGRATAEFEAEGPTLDDLQPAALRERGQLWPDGRPPAGFWKRVVPRLSEFVGRRPCGLARRPAGLESAACAPDKPFDPFVTRILSRQALAGLKAVATRRGVTPNELYLLAMFRTLKLWNVDHGREPWLKPYRIGVPTSLRSPLHDGSPAANVLSYVFLTRHVQSLADEDALLRYIHRESEILLSSGDSRLLPMSLAWLRRVPGAMALTTRIPFRFVTAMLANVGEVRRQLGNRFPLKRGRCVAGNVTLEALLGAAPVRPGSSVGTSVGTYAGRLFINFNCDPLRFSTAAAGQFADLFVAQLSDIAGFTSRECASEVAVDGPPEATMAEDPLPEVLWNDTCNAASVSGSS